MKLEEYISESISTGKHKKKYGSRIDDGFFSNVKELKPQKLIDYLEYLGFPEIRDVNGLRELIQKGYLGYTTFGIDIVGKFTVRIVNRDKRYLYSVAFSKGKLLAITEYRLDGGPLTIHKLYPSDDAIKTMTDWIESSPGIRGVSEAISTGKHKKKYKIYLNFFSDIDDVSVSSFTEYLEYLGLKSFDNGSKYSDIVKLRAPGYTIRQFPFDSSTVIEIFGKNGKYTYYVSFNGKGRINEITREELYRGGVMRKKLDITDENLKMLTDWIESSDDSLGLNEAISTGKHRKIYNYQDIIPTDPCENADEYLARLSGSELVELDLGDMSEYKDVKMINIKTPCYQTYSFDNAYGGKETYITICNGDRKKMYRIYFENGFLERIKMGELKPSTKSMHYVIIPCDKYTLK